MSDSRLTFALRSGALHLPQTGAIAVFRPRAEADLSALPRERVEIVQGNRADHDSWARRGFRTDVAAPEDFAAAIVMLPRSKAEAKALIAEAAAQGGVVIVDGQKSDGVDSILREIRKRCDVAPPVSKAHGKIFAVQPGPGLFADWALPPVKRLESGWVTAPGVFSADGPDPASVALAEALPAKMPGRVADLGAGWGYLAFHVLERAGVTECVLVEAEHAALEAARMNIADDRARFLWEDVTQWSDGAPFDHVVMNPPFHASRAADPTLGAAFIAAAARNLSGHGTLWLVANRHLPYEAPLNAGFGEVRELDGTPGFKILAARRPKSGARPKR
ncbi:class I SAM-dependent methyltransferase [Tropicimonas sp. IMCC6043]|uniref:class I SAM-dependent methyltransferase n=1 Tax=Tropicimonas sp. IMCC6043 TaxID=2510645 RepID=UPI00101CF4C5|nr:methyltransferase [Tropicimonas sp. IMCC6043]RYH08240.1 class I SAM-dependent methyltransferase [Tropicimonas sp. IMCC6043]